MSEELELERDAGWWQGEGRVQLDREVWGAIIAGWDSDDPADRFVVLDALISAAPESWDEDLDRPEVLAERLRGLRARPLPGWESSRLRLAPGDTDADGDRGRGVAGGLPR